MPEKPRVLTVARCPEKCAYALARYKPLADSIAIPSNGCARTIRRISRELHFSRHASIAVWATW